MPAIAFGLAIQNASFSKIEGMGYNNAFTTGNLKNPLLLGAHFSLVRIKSQHTAYGSYQLHVSSYQLHVISYFIWN